MPSVNSSGIIAVSAEYINIIRGQQASITISLHKDYVGNAINIGAITDVVAEYVNTDNQIFKTESKSANTLTYGAANSDQMNQISISLSASETAALPLNDNNINGECWVRFKVTEGISEVVLPILKLGNVYDAGDQIGEIVASRYGVPSTVYSVAGANNTYYANNNPSQGQIIFNAPLPSQVTKFKIALKDDKGVRNKYFENLLEERLDQDGLKSNIFFTNTRNNSEYSVFKLVSYTRLDILNADPLAPNSSDDDDALEVTVQYEANSTTPGEIYQIADGDSFGLFYETFFSREEFDADTGITVTVNELAPVDGLHKIKFTGGLNANLGPGQDEITIALSESATTSGTSGTSGIDGVNGNDGTSGTSGIDGVGGNDGTSGTSGLDGAPGAQGPQGDAGAQGPEGPTGAQGAPGPAGANGIAGADGTSGTSGTSGVDGAAGPVGPAGAPGAPGAEGPAGPAGQDGVIGGDGVDGTSGTSGVDGAQGLPGNAGAPGNDGTSGTSGIDGATGTSGTSGVDGQQGAPGNAGAPGNDGTSGTSGIDGAAGTSGTSGVDGAPGGQGAEGAPGPAGLNGNDGTSGTSGVDGNAGAPGTSGVDGNNGNDGTSGTSGLNGNDGTSGTSGIDGAAGDAGVDGTSGTSGVNGAPGQAGPAGNDGTSGTSGVDGVSNIPGPAGPTGDAGEDGTSGTSGVDGNNGNDGTSGTSGVDGAAGDAGADGTSGTSGADGNDGTSGTSGVDGVSNIPGPEGPAGADGTSGTSGINGSDGVNGNDGTSGTSGVDGAAGDAGADGTSGTSGADGNDGTSGTSGINGSDGANGNDGADGTSGTSGVDGNDGSGVPAGGTEGQALVKASGTDYDVEWGAAVGGGSGTMYLAKVDFDAAEAITTITMQDPPADGTFTTDNVTTGTSAGGNGEKFAEFTFAGETRAPHSIVAFAANMVTDEYKITHLNGGGDDKSYLISNVTMTNTSGNFYEGNIFTGFNGNTIKIDLTKANVDYVRKPFPAREAHVYLLFSF
jgi:hypothetical protein